MIVQSLQIFVSLLLILLVPVGLGCLIPKRQNYLSLNFYLGLLILNFIYLFIYKIKNWFQHIFQRPWDIDYNHLTVFLLVFAGVQVYRFRQSLKVNINVANIFGVAAIFSFFNFIYGSPLYHNIFSNIHFLKSAEEIYNFNILNPLTADSYLPTLQLLFYLAKLSGVSHLIAVNFFVPLVAAFLFYDIMERILSQWAGKTQMDQKWLAFSTIMILLFLFKFVNLNANNIAFLGLLIGIFETMQSEKPKSQIELNVFLPFLVVFGVSVISFILFKRIDGFLLTVTVLIGYALFSKRYSLELFLIWGTLFFIHRVSLINVGFLFLLIVVINFRSRINILQSIGLLLSAVFFSYLTYRYEYLVKTQMPTFKVMSNISLKFAEWVRLVPISAFVMSGFVFIRGGFRNQWMRALLLLLVVMMVLTYSVLSEFMRITSAVVFVFAILFCFEYVRFIFSQQRIHYLFIVLFLALAISIAFKLRGDFNNWEHYYFRMVVYAGSALFLLAIGLLVFSKNIKQSLYCLSLLVFSFDIFYTTNRYHSFSFGEHRTVKYPITQMTPELYSAAEKLKQLSLNKNALLIGDPVVISGLKALTGYNSFFYYENVSDFSNLNYRNHYFIFMQYLNRGELFRNFDQVYSSESRYVFRDLDCESFVKAVYYVDTQLMQKYLSDFDPEKEEYFPFNPSTEPVNDLEPDIFVKIFDQSSLKIYQLSQNICN